MTYAEQLVEKQKRNESLWSDRCKGMTFEQLAEKYKISNARAQAIYKQVCQYKGANNGSNQDN